MKEKQWQTSTELEVLDCFEQTLVGALHERRPSPGETKRAASKKEG